ncbi:MAG: RICIN domain-containing protein [Clostridia bacterium]|nr:RICIN domain-containing protein [Clostridia bacterium]
MAVKTEKKYILTNRRSGKVLTANGTDAVQLAANGSDEQIWRAVPTEGTAVQLVNKATGLALCVNAETEDGAPVVLGEEAQEWKLTTTTKGYRKLVHVASGKVVDIKEISDDDFAPAQLWAFVKGENQDWVAEEVEKKAPAKRAAKTK